MNIINIPHGEVQTFQTGKSTLVFVSLGRKSISEVLRPYMELRL